MARIVRAGWRPFSPVSYYEPGLKPLGSGQLVLCRGREIVCFSAAARIYVFYYFGFSFNFLNGVLF
jgi:hypothetical protein